jgi:hypothetical protein
MLIKESKLRQIIKSVIRESMSGNRRRLKENDSDEYFEGNHVMGGIPEYIADENAHQQGMELWFKQNPPNRLPQYGDELNGKLGYGPDAIRGNYEYTSEGWLFSQTDPRHNYYEENYVEPSDAEMRAWKMSSSNPNSLRYQEPIKPIFQDVDDFGEYSDE